MRLDIAMQVNHLAVNLFRSHACLETDFVYRGGDLGFKIYFVMTGKLVVRAVSIFLMDMSLSTQWAYSVFVILA